MCEKQSNGCNWFPNDNWSSFPVTDVWIKNYIASTNTMHNSYCRKNPVRVNIHQSKLTFQSDLMGKKSRRSITLRASPASRATRIRICSEGASFVHMEFFLSYGVDRNKAGNVVRQLWNHVSISRISSPEKRRNIIWIIQKYLKWTTSKKNQSLTPSSVGF